MLTFDVNMKKQDMLLSEFGRIRDVFMDGSYLYFISNNTDGRAILNPMTINYTEYRYDIIFVKTWNGMMNGED